MIYRHVFITCLRSAFVIFEYKKRRSHNKVKKKTNSFWQRVQLELPENGKYRKSFLQIDLILAKFSFGVMRSHAEKFYFVPILVFAFFFLFYFGAHVTTLQSYYFLLLLISIAVRVKSNSESRKKILEI